MGRAGACVGVGAIGVGVVHERIDNMATRWVRLFRLTRDEASFAAALRGQTRGALLGLDVSDRRVGVALSDEE